MTGGESQDDSREVWSARIDAARTIEELDAIDVAIPRDGKLSSLRFKIGMRKLAVRKNGGGGAVSSAANNVTLDQSAQGLTKSSTSTQRRSLAVITASRRSAVQTELRPFAQAYGLPASNGGPLYAYRLSDEGFVRLQADLARKDGYAALEVGYTPGLFVLWASEWFRRCHDGGGHKWKDLTSVLGLPDPANEQKRLHDIVKNGLRLWQRDVIDLGSKFYLATLAREGGFPASAINDGGRGWAKDVLVAVIAPMLGNSTSDEEQLLAQAHELTRAQQTKLPKVYQDDDFVELCADLALAIVRLRREGEHAAQAEGIPVAAWLSQNQPDWRDTLPLTAGDAAANALVDVLLKVEAVVSTSVSTDRLLVFDGTSGLWKEGVRINLDGEIPGLNVGKFAETSTRLRAYATGALARYYAGELMLLEPPFEGEKSWTARSARQARAPRQMPFSVPVEVDLRAGTSWVERRTLPFGKPRRGELFVAELSEGSLDAPTILRVIGSGSGNYRAEHLFLRIPADWLVAVHEGEAAADMGLGVNGGGEAVKVWRVSGAITLTDPGGDQYRILCGQTLQAANRLELDGARVTFAEVCGMADLFVGPPRVLRNGGGEVVYRPIGQRTWRIAPNPVPVGYHELGWRRDGFLLDRRRIAVLPSKAGVSVSRAARGTSFTLTDFDGVTVTPSEDAPVSAEPCGRRWLPRQGALPVSSFTARIVWQGAPPLEVRFGYPGVSGVAGWDGRLLPRNSKLTLDDLADLIAISDGSAELMASLRDPETGQHTQMSWAFTREMPLSEVADDIASMLLPTDLRARVLLELLDGFGNNWSIEQFAHRWKRVGEGVVAVPGVIDEGVRLCGRCFSDPANEIDFGAYSLLTDANHRPVELPQELTGTWLFYLRSGERILSDWVFQRYAELVDEPVSLLGRAMALPPGSQLDDALQTLLGLAGGEGEEADALLAELLALVLSLRGLPPSIFRVFTLLVDAPDTLARMAMTASGEDRDVVLALSKSLPFGWSTLPQSAWNKARFIAFSELCQRLKMLGDDAARFAKEAIDSAEAALIEGRPLLAAVLQTPGVGKRDEIQTIETITMRFLNRDAFNRVKEPCRERYRARLGHALPAHFKNFDHSILDILDAPCAAALAVHGKWRPDASDIRHIKGVSRSFPTWFAEAFAISLKEQK